MDKVMYGWWNLTSFLMVCCFSIYTGESSEYILPLYIPAVSEDLPTVLFVNEGQSTGVANVSIPNVSLVDESILVTAYATFVLCDTLRSFDIDNGTTIVIFIRTSDTIRPYVSLRESQPSIAIQPVSTVGKDYYLYDTKGYNLNSYCLDILSLDNDTQIQIKDTKQGAINPSSDIILNEFESNRLCLLSELQSTHVVSSNPVILTISGDYKFTGTPSLIDILVSHSYWGKIFTVCPLLHNQNYQTFVRIFCVESDSTVSYQNNKQITIPAGDYVDIEIIEPLTLVSSTPVIVTLSTFEKSSFYNTPHEHAVSDPILNIRVMPFEQYISRTYIQSATGSNKTTAMIFTICFWLSHITFDYEALDSKPDAEVTTIMNSEYCLIKVPINPETAHEVRSHLQSATFTVMVNVTSVNTSYVYNVRGLDKSLNCKTLIYGHQLYEHECDVQVYERNTSCSGPPLTCYNEKSKCSSCIRLYGLIAFGVGSAVGTIVLNVFCQLWYCPRRTRKKDIKIAKQREKDKEAEKERIAKEQIKHAQIIFERSLIAAKVVRKPTDNTKFYELIASLKEGAQIK